MNAKKLTTLLAIATSVLLAGCGEDDPLQPNVAGSDGSFRGVVEQGGTYEDVQPGEVVLSSVTDEEYNPADQTIWRCTTERVSVVETPEDYATFNPNAEVIYPGSLLQGATLADATPEPIVVRRAPGTISIDLLNGSGGVSQYVDEVKRSTIAQAGNDIIEANSGVVPAAFTFASSEVQSTEQMALSMGVNVSTLTTDVRSRLSFRTDQQYSRFLVVFNQRFYTMSYDLPTSLDELFAPSVTPQDLAPYVGSGNPATYISSVTYGRRFYLLIESTASSTAMSASIQGSYDAALAAGGGSFEGTYVKDLENVQIKIFALGGDAGSATSAFNGDLSGLSGFLSNADIRTGVPLSYVVRNVSDNAIVNVKVATDYDRKTCEAVGSAVIRSGFDSNLEGWSGSGDFHDLKRGDHPAFRYVGPYIWAKDEADGGTWYFRASDRYHGDMSRFFGGLMSFALNVGAGRNGDPRVNGDYFDADDVILSGATKTLVYRIPTADRPVAQSFKLYRLSLDGTGSWQVVQGGSRRPATDADVQEVLDNITSLRIRGEWFIGLDWGSLDEVEFRSPLASDG